MLSLCVVQESLERPIIYLNRIRNRTEVFDQGHHKDCVDLHRKPFHFTNFVDKSSERRSNHV